MNNAARRFHVFLANRVQQIRTHTDPEQWQHVTSKNNPAGFATQSLFPSEFVKKTSWLRGPEFLWKEDVHLTDNAAEISVNDSEAKQVQSLATSTKTANPSMTER